MISYIMKVLAGSVFVRKQRRQGQTGEESSRRNSCILQFALALCAQRRRTAVSAANTPKSWPVCGASSGTAVVEVTPEVVPRF